MLLRPAFESAVAYLEASSIGSPRMNAEVLLMFTLGCDRAYLYAHPERELTDDEHRRYGEVLRERARGVPSQYITGHQEFWGLDFIVTPAVLIPRPETEHAVETVLGLIKSLTAEDAEHGGCPTSARRWQMWEDRPRILDVGTGSGCIALALASELPQADISAADISPEALEVARANAARLQLAHRVRFLESDLLSALPGAERFDIIVSNPPYVGEFEADKVQREVRKFEPKVAVFAGQDGLDAIRRLIPQARERLNPGGWLVMEIGYTQSEAVCGLVHDWAEVRIVNDLQGIPRVIAARR